MKNCSVELGRPDRRRAVLFGALISDSGPSSIDQEEAMEYTQAGRPIRLDTPLGKTFLLLETVQRAEAVSQQFSFNLRAVSTSAALALDDLLQRPVLVTLELVSGAYRYITAS